MLNQRVQTIKPKLEKPQRAPPAHMQAPHEPMQLPWTNACKPLEENRAAASAQLWPVRPVTLTGQTGGQDRPAPGNYTGATWETARAQK
jgi:hypothetical protein